MTYRVRIEVSGRGTRYIANVNTTSLLTRNKSEARRFHNSLNADIAAGEWERTLIDLGLVGEATLEEWAS